MSTPKNPILIGIIAGLAAAILLGVAAYASVFAVVLTIAAMASIFIAGLGYGLLSSLVSILAAAFATAALYSNPMSGVGMALILAPAAVMSYLANLARPASEIGGPETALAWYPLSDILLAGGVVTAVSTVATLFLHPDIDAVYAAVAEMVGTMMSEIDPSAPFGADMRTKLVSFLQVLFPMIQGMQMMIALFAVFYFGMRILSAAGRSTRPREDIRSSLRMNRLAIVVFLAGVALMFGGDTLEVIGAGFAGAVAGGFLLSGFAILHNMLRDKSWRLPGLVLAYLLTVMVPLVPLILVIAGGLSNPRRAVALTPHKPTQTSTNQP